jgi:hypothetical protein
LLEVFFIKMVVLTMQFAFCKLHGGNLFFRYQRIISIFEIFGVAIRMRIISIYLDIYANRTFQDH